MSQGKLAHSPNDLHLSRSERDARAEAIRCDKAFVRALARASNRGKETVNAGTFVDTSPPSNALRLRGTYPISACGSPSAMCMEHGSHHGGAETLK